MEAKNYLHHQAMSLKNNGSLSTSSRLIQELDGKIPLKRKCTLESDCDLDLNLSLKIRPKDDEVIVLNEKGLEGHGEVHNSTLALSLSSSTSSLKLSRLKEKGGDDQDTKQARRMATSTLDLTL